MFRNRFITLVLLILALVACQTAEEPAPPTAAPLPTTALTETATAEPAPTDAPTAEPTLPPTTEPTAEPTATPVEEEEAEEEATAVPTPEPPSVIYEGIQFEQGGLATAVLPTLVPEQITGNDGPFWDTYPAYYQFDFEGYPLEETFHTPRLTIYPAPAYAGLNLAAREQIEALTTLLADPATGLAQDNLPFVPLFNAAQVFHSQAEIVEFSNGRGVRYLTAYAQSIFPLSNQELFYTFQGLTDDGAYYISAIFPISSAILPNTPPNLTTEEWEELGENYMEYLAETTAALDALTADEFLPTLSSLDQLVQSLEAIPPQVELSVNNRFVVESPVTHGQYLAGETMQASGIAAPNSGEIGLILFAGPQFIIETSAAVDDTGAWSTALELPANFVGPGQLRVQAGDYVEFYPFHIYPELGDPEDSSLPRVIVHRPYTGELFVAGITNFISGEVSNPVDDTVTIVVYEGECGQTIASQSFTVTGGEWTGQLILPRDSAGPACVGAYTGTYAGTGESYMWLVETEIVTADDPTAPRIQIGNQYGSFPKGQIFTLFGSAINAPDNTVQLLIAREDGTEIVNTTAVVDTFGYWSAEILLPADTPPFILITASFTDDDQLYQSQTGFTVE